MAKSLKNIIPACIFIFLISLQCATAQSGLIETIHFKTNSFTIQKNDRNMLDDMAKKCASDTFGFLKIYAYTDTTGSDSFNDNLSKKRAYEVYNYLYAHAKFDTSMVYVEWLGNSGEDVAYDLHFPTAHFQQRCVDIIIMFKQKPIINKPK